MTSTYNPTGTQQTLQSSEIKSLIQKHGRVTFGDTEFVLKHPTPTDPTLQEIVNDPAFTATPAGRPSENGDCEYDLRASGKSLKIKVASNSRS